MSQFVPLRLVFSLYAPAIMGLALQGCTGTEDRDVGWVVRDSAGITIVENDHTRPAWSDATTWRLSEEPVVRIGSVEGDPTMQLYQVTHSLRLADGRIALVNSGSSEVRLYDAQGGYVGAIGRSGEGPGEFLYPWAVHQIRGDSILVINIYRDASVFDSEGTFARRFLLDRSEPVGQFGDGTLLFRSAYPQDLSRRGIARTRISMTRTLLDGSFAGSLGDFDDQTSNLGGPSNYFFGAWAQEAPSDSTMWYGPGDRFEIREVAFDGGTLRLVRLDRPLRPVTEADLAAELEGIMERVRGTAQEQTYNRRYADAEYPDFFPAHFEIKTDEMGNLWVQDYRPFNLVIERLWSVFSVEGRFLGDVTIPAGLAVHEIGAEYVLGRWTDELDVEYVLMYELLKPEG